jgi:hypothetical protein
MSSSLRYPTNWIVYSTLQQLKQNEIPVNNTLVNLNKISVNNVFDNVSIYEISLNEQISDKSLDNSLHYEFIDELLDEKTFILEYFTLKPDEFTVPLIYGKLMEKYDSENKNNYFVSKITLKKGQMICSKQLENGFIVNVQHPKNIKNSLTMILPYKNYRKHSFENKTTYIHTFDDIYNLVQS